MTNEVKFIADRMLGRLSKWMRALGLDVVYVCDMDRSSMIGKARDEGRVILTRASNFKELKHIPPYFLIKDERLEGQLEQIFSEYKDIIRSENFFSRCMECNGLLEFVDRSSVAEKVPPKAYEMHDEFRKCPECGRVYWSGTHVTRMKKLLGSLKILSL